MIAARRPLQLMRTAQISLQRSSYSTNATLRELDLAQARNQNHHDLESFLKHASKTDLDQESTVYVGTHYEYTVQQSLEQLGFSLKRIGGANDYGIDLLGTWVVPSADEPLKVLLQCKASSVVLKPHHARELEGAFAGGPPGWRGPDVLGLLVSPKPVTKGMRGALSRSTWPMAYVMCAPDGRAFQMLWNKQAEKKWLEGMGVGLKYTGGDITEKEVMLMWKGEPIHN